MRKLWRLAALSIIWTLCSTIAAAEDFPSKRITLVVPFPAGSATDGVARRVATEIGKLANVPVTVDNRASADGNIAALSVLRSEPDGYTVYVGTNSTQAANVHLFKSMPFDPKVDFAPVSGLVKIPIMLVVRSDFPAKNLAEYIARARNRPQPLTFGTSSQTGRGAGELFKQREQLIITNVPYRGSPQALTSLLGGRCSRTRSAPLAWCKTARFGCSR